MACPSSEKLNTGNVHVATPSKLASCGFMPGNVITTSVCRPDIDLRPDDDWIVAAAHG
jgi:hypothetical protein